MMVIFPSERLVLMIGDRCFPCGELVHTRLRIVVDLADLVGYPLDKLKE